MDFGSVEQGQRQHGVRIALKVPDDSEPRALLSYAECPQCHQMVNTDPGISPRCWSCGLLFHSRRRPSMQRSVQWVLEDYDFATHHQQDDWVCNYCGGITAVTTRTCSVCGRDRVRSGG